MDAHGIALTDAVRERFAVDTASDLPACAWPGGYAIAYYVSDGDDTERLDGTLCAACAGEEGLSGTIFAWDVLDEVSTTCDHCYTVLGVDPLDD